MAVYKRTYKGYSGPLTATWSRFSILPRYSYARLFNSKFLIMFLVVVPTVAFPGELLGPALTAGALFVAALLAMVALVYGSRRHDRFPGSLLRRMETGRWTMAGRAVQQMVAGVRALGSRRSVALLVVYTVLIWGTHALLIWLVMQAFHLDVPFTGAVLTSAVLSLGMAVPSSPGYVGVWDYLFVVTAGLYGVHKTPALAAALAFHAIAFVPVTLIGLVYIARAGLETTMHMVQSGRPDGREAAATGAEGRMRGTGAS